MASVGKMLDAARQKERRQCVQWTDSEPVPTPAPCLWPATYWGCSKSSFLSLPITEWKTPHLQEENYWQRTEGLLR